MLNSVTIIPLTQKPYIVPQFGILVDKFSSSCETCNISSDLYAQTFNVTFKANLTAFEATGTAPAIFASTSFPNRNGWWVAANTTNTTDYLHSLNQRWSLGGGCFGRPGRLYIVVCLPREGFQFNKGESTHGPPFDDRCAVLGSRCGGTCGIGISTPPNCTNDGIIPLELILSQRGLRALQSLSNDTILPYQANFSTSVIDANQTDDDLIVVSGGAWTISFLFFSYLSIIIFLVNHCAPIASLLEATWVRFDSGSRRDTPWAASLTPEALVALPDGHQSFVREPRVPYASAITSIDDMFHKTQRLVMITCSVFAGERTFHIFRNVLGVYTSWWSLHQVCSGAFCSGNLWANHLHYRRFAMSCDFLSANSFIALLTTLEAKESQCMLS